MDNPPDILLTNYVMLELILTRPYEQKLVQAASHLKFLVFDELHTYRGRQGSDVAMLIRRLRNVITPTGFSDSLQCIGTSATLAGPGTLEEQQREVALIASKLFGSEVMPHRIIMETLRRETDYNGYRSPEFLDRLKDRIADPPSTVQDYEEFINDPLSIWIENNLGLEEKEDRLMRCVPLSIRGDQGVAARLADQTGLSRETCETVIQKTLLDGYAIKSPEAGDKPVFAFKLHQFLSKGDTVYATPEPEQTRSITLQGQQYAPNRESLTALFPPPHSAANAGKSTILYGAYPIPIRTGPGFQPAIPGTAYGKTGTPDICISGKTNPGLMTISHWPRNCPMTGQKK